MMEEIDMISSRLMLAIVVLMGFVGTRADASFQTYTSSASFYSSLAARGITPTIEGYQSYAANSLITAGTTLNGVTYTSFPAGTSGRIDTLYNNIGGRSLGLQRGTDATSYFFAGDSLSVTFTQPTFEIGIFFNSDVTSTTSDLYINTAVGSATNGGPATNFDQSTLFFVGLISTTAFTSATIGEVSTAKSFNLDNLTFGGSVVPEPSSLALTAIAGLMGAGFAWRRRRFAPAI